VRLHYLGLCNESVGSHNIKGRDANDTFGIVDSLKFQHLAGNWNSRVDLHQHRSTSSVNIRLVSSMRGRYTVVVHKAVADFNLVIRENFYPFGALTPLVGQQEGNAELVCWWC